MATFNPQVDTDIQIAKQANNGARALVHRLKAQYPNHEFLLSGYVPAMAAYSQAAVHDVSVLLPLALIIAMLAMFCYLRFESGHWGTACASVMAALVLIVCSVRWIQWIDATHPLNLSSDD